MSIPEKISAYFADVTGEHDCERSWEHCYTFFHEYFPGGFNSTRDHAALHLGFYLASWGMYRPSSFLFQHAYTVHLGVVDCLVTEEVSSLWTREFGAAEDDVNLIPSILQVVDAVRRAYRPFGNATDTLVTKVLL